MTKYRSGTVENLHLSVDCPQTDRPRLPERMEQKFFIVPRRIPLARALLLRTCRLDPEYAEGQVNSVYFDTGDVDQHERSVSGELVKDKVRIRWYTDEYDAHRLAAIPGGPDLRAEDRVKVWLELKSRRGFSSTKQRRSVSVWRGNLASAVLSLGVVPPAAVIETMADFGFFAPRPMRPVIFISYTRHRFVEPFTGYRISIDTRIRSSLLLPGREFGENGLELPGAVVEVKCPVLGLPYSMRELDEIGSSWGRFSKYSACLEAHEAARGTVSRLWPSGLMEEEPGMLASVRRVGPAEQRRDKPGRAPGLEPTR
jgi:hypothetical protein